MTLARPRDPIYPNRRFVGEIIELCVRWYITYWLSYRDLVAMVAERGVEVSHTTILRWVARYVPEYEARWNRWARRLNRSWRVDETYVRVGRGWHYLIRGLDKYGKTIGSLLRPNRNAAAFFR
jgi:transposase-like protein